MGVLEDLGIWGPILTVAGISALFSLGLQLQVGHGGLLNFGQVGFMAVGAYTMAILTGRGVSLPVAVLLALLAAVVLATIVSLPTFRLRGDFLAITTIAAGEIVRILANNLQFTGGPKGLVDLTFRAEYVRPVLRSARDAGWDIDRALPLLVVVWVATVLVAAGLRFVLATPWGRVLRAVREDEDATRALGKNVFLYKLQAMTIGAAIAGLAGVFYAWNQVQFSPAGFEPIVTFVGYVVIIVAGIGSIWGTLVAAMLFQGLLEGLRYINIDFLTGAQEGALRYMLVGVALMLVIYLRPQGIFGRREEMVLE